MRLRRPIVLLVAVLACVGLAGCRTNLNLAASIDGHRYTESDISTYLTRDAKPLSVTDQSGAATSVGPRSAVVEVLIEKALLQKVASKLFKRTITDRDLDTEFTKLAGGATARAVGKQQGFVGYSAKFYQELVRALVASQELSGLQQQLQQQQGKQNEVSAAIRGVPFPVTVNPRYGAWNSSTRRFSSAADAGVPGYLRLVASPSAAAPAGQ